MSGKNGAIKLVAGNSNPSLAAAIGEAKRGPTRAALT